MTVFQINIAVLGIELANHNKEIQSLSYPKSRGFDGVKQLIKVKYLIN